MRLVTAELHKADGDAGVAQELAHRPNDIGPVVVAWDQPSARGEGEIQPVAVDGEEVSRVRLLQEGLATQSGHGKWARWGVE